MTEVITVTHGLPPAHARPAVHPATPARITLAQYHQMIASGIIGEDDRLELIDGYLLEKRSINPPHAVALRRTRRLFDGRIDMSALDIHQESPLSIETHSELEPDLMIVVRREDDYLSGHPTPADVTLLIEVADDSLTRDRMIKKPIYAEAGIPEYWIINLRERQLERYTAPFAARPEIGEPASYAEATVFAAGDTLADVSLGRIDIAALLPRGG